MFADLVSRRGFGLDCSVVAKALGQVVQYGSPVTELERMRQNATRTAWSPRPRVAEEKGVTLVGSTCA